MFLFHVSTMHPPLLIIDHLQTVTDDEGALTSTDLQKKLVGYLFLEKPFYLKL